MKEERTLPTCVNNSANKWLDTVISSEHEFVSTVAGGKNDESWCAHLLLLFIKCPFCELNSAQYLDLSQLIHKVNTHIFLQSAECLQLCGHAVSQRAKIQTSASEVVMGTQLIKHFKNIISVRPIYLFFFP